MRPWWHVLIGMVFTLVVWLVAPDVGFLNLGLIFLASFFRATALAFLTFLPLRPAEACFWSAARAWNFSIRLALSTSFCLPV